MNQMMYLGLKIEVFGLILFIRMFTFIMDVSGMTYEFYSACD